MVPVTERGFFGGDGIYEVTRTFGHKLFSLDKHLDRLFRSPVRIDVGITREELAAATRETLDRNVGRIDTRSDYAVWHVITRGDNVMGGPSPTIVALFCVEIEFDIYASTYVNGLRLITPASGAPRWTLQHRPQGEGAEQGMNQIQAALEVKRVDPGATPLMPDGDGNITETNTGNFFFVADGKLCTSRARTVLGGVTRATILELAAELCIEVVEGDYTSYDVYAADEAFVCSTTPVIMPAVSLNGAPIGSSGNDGRLPGPITLRLMQAFIDCVGLITWNRRCPSWATTRRLIGKGVGEPDGGIGELTRWG